MFLHCMLFDFSVNLILDLSELCCSLHQDPEEMKIISLQKGTVIILHVLQ